MIDSSYVDFRIKERMKAKREKLFSAAISDNKI